ncbi:hypothetical protein EN851_19555 [Mesorhizobium sp. M8A.F.Ca.ET.208.01.1.1]|nr:hypothetical protein EN851_19555 [Mesorhizobium sp. M8A.F.Ca.ET.208.01.1.1]TGT51696.1 hypothetical protein EN810_19545 [Mesorhizobium sp. M8A.F.Ca.ET.167.01.1.1]
MRKSVLLTDVKRLTARGKPQRTFPGIARLLFSRNSGQKTAAHFSWNCFSSPARPSSGPRRAARSPLSSSCGRDRPGW